jgi:hypothetical protein
MQSTKQATEDLKNLFETAPIAETTGALEELDKQ